jgi:hypothetical protein
MRLMRPSPAIVPPHKPEPHSLAFNLGAIMLMVAMLVLALAWGLDALMRHQQHVAVSSVGSEAMIKRTLVGRDLNIPASWLRGADGASGGFATEIDLELNLPLGKDESLKPVDVTLLPQSQARSSASLLDGVYLHQFMPNELSGPPGLVGKPLYGTEGYEGETVWYDALSSNPFVAKCVAPADGHGPSRCLRTVALSTGIAAVYAFDSDVLPQWRNFDPELQKWLGKIGAL